MVDNITKIRGGHTFKFGFEARRSRNHEFNFQTVSGAFSFSTQPSGLPGNAATGSGLASLLLGFPTGFSQLQTQELDRSSWYLAGFAQDDWRVNQSLTLNLGLRWETDTPMVDTNDRMNSFDQQQINPVSGTPGVVKFIGLNGFRSAPYDGDWNNFGPRFGFAWKILGSERYVVRGGYGIFFAHPFDAGVPNAVALGFSVSRELNSPDNGITAPFYLRDGVPAATATTPKLDDSFGAVPLGTNPNTAVTFFEQNRKTGYSQQFNLGVQAQLSSASVVEVTLLGNLSRKLASTPISINQISPSLLGPQHQSQRDRPFPQFSNVMIQSPTLGLANYYGAMIRYQKRYSKGLILGANYTWSRFFDNTNEVGATLGDNGGPYSNFYDRSRDYGPSANDIRHRAVIHFVYELPFGSGRKWLSSNPLKYVVGGWSISGVTTLQSGAPFTVTTQTNTTNSFSAGALRADVLRNPNLDSSERSVQRWFDTTAFAQPAPYQFGNQGVGLVRSAGLMNFDLSLLREFRFTERLRAELRGEFFNALNHTNFNIPGRVFGAPASVLSAAPGQQGKLRWAPGLLFDGRTMTRRRFLSMAGAAATSVAAPLKRPHILFVIADDWGFGHAGAYGCKWINTPAFDRIAREGVLFTRAFTSNPKCSPCRATILTGRNTWQLKEAINHYSIFPNEFAVYPAELGKRRILRRNDRQRLGSGRLQVDRLRPQSGGSRISGTQDANLPIAASARSTTRATSKHF